MYQLGPSAAICCPSMWHHGRGGDTVATGRSWPRALCWHLWGLGLLITGTCSFLLFLLSPEWRNKREVPAGDEQQHLPHKASSLVSAQKGMVKGKMTSKYFLESTLYSGFIKRGQKSRGDLNPLFFAIISWIRAATLSITLLFAADFYPITESNKKIGPKDYYLVDYSRFHWHG